MDGMKTMPKTDLLDQFVMATGHYAAINTTQDMDHFLKELDSLYEAMTPQDQRRAREFLTDILPHLASSPLPYPAD